MTEVSDSVNFSIFEKGVGILDSCWDLRVLCTLGRDFAGVKFGCGAEQILTWLAASLGGLPGSMLQG